MTSKQGATANADVHGIIWMESKYVRRGNQKDDKASMRDDPGIDPTAIGACLRDHYGLTISEITFLPIGYDFNAFVYRVVADTDVNYFLKLRNGPVPEPSLVVPRTLTEAGVPNILSPLRTQTGELWCDCADHGAILYPFIAGQNASRPGLSEDQWRTFGATLRAVHDSGLSERFRDLLPRDPFALPSATVVRQMAALADQSAFTGGAAVRLADRWQTDRQRIARLLARTEELGAQLRARPWDLVLCHADIHAANILVGNDGRIWLVDWDGPLIAPREHDFLFVVGSTIVRTVEPHEEVWFFAGYGPTDVDRDALAFFRYERIIEDIGEFAKSVWLDPALSEETRDEMVDYTDGYLVPGGPIETAEVVVRYW